MKIALTARIVLDPRLVRESQWAHDTVHQFVNSRMEAQQDLEGQPSGRGR